MAETPAPDRRGNVDTLTVAAIAAAAYVLATALHEHLGHAAACLALGGRLRELNAFYVDCDYRGMGETGVRAVALAGPVVSLLTGAVGFAVLRRLRRPSAQLRVWLWLLGSIGLMAATGYLLFSGVAGIGDLGVGPDGALRGATPAWLWRTAIVVAGVVGYALAVRASVRAMERLIGGSGPGRVRRAQRLSLTGYLAGGLVSVVIGLFNPRGLFVVLISSAASSLGGTSGLAWGMQWMDRRRESADPPLLVPRSGRWIAAGLAAVLLYGALLGPSLRP